MFFIFSDTEFSVSFHIRIIVDSCVIVAVVTSHSAFIPLWHSFLLHMMSMLFICHTEFNIDGQTGMQTPFEKDVGLKGNEVQFHMCAKQQIRLKIWILHPLTWKFFFSERSFCIYSSDGKNEKTYIASTPLGSSASGTETDCLGTWSRAPSAVTRNVVHFLELAVRT